MVGGSSIFALSALAVDSEMVGNDKDGELICCEEGERYDCCCAAAAARRAAVAVRVSLFGLGVVEKKLGNFFALGDVALRGKSFFSL